MNAAKIRQEISKLTEERYRLEKEILSERQKMTRASLFEVFTKCSKAGCKCTKGEPHGPFLYMNVIIKGKNIQKYVGKKVDQKIVGRLRRYKVFQSNITTLNKVNKKISELFRGYKKELVEEVETGGKDDAK